MPQRCIGQRNFRGSGGSCIGSPREVNAVSKFLWAKDALRVYDEPRKDIMMRLGGLAHQPGSWLKTSLRALLTSGALLAMGAGSWCSSATALQNADAATAVSPLPEGKLFSPEQLTALLPSTVYFQGRTASLQMRNAAGLRFAGRSIFWASLVDTSGYASDVQERYEFYLVTEGTLRIGTTVLPPGAYGGGFPGGHFVIMDLGGHTLAQGPTQGIPASLRPRPLQLFGMAPDAVNLCLRRQCVAIHALAGGAQ